MAIPQVNLTASDDTKWRFTYLPSGLFTASLDSNTVTISSSSARVYASSFSSFEIFFELALFQFPHSELQKFNAFLLQVNDAKAVA